MALECSTMENYNTQLVNCIDEMHEKRKFIVKKIAKKEEKKTTLLETMTKLQKELTVIDEDLVKCKCVEIKYDQTIKETEIAYMKILESSQTLLHIIKRESNKISKKQ
uniref:Uncharacterized protein n=1 Tax=viral metagenome TaxID=1070528 RepID=A0A6C0C3B3_9ZZZZ